MTSLGGNGSSSTGGLQGGSRLLERDEVERERDGEASAALWAALAQRVSSPAPFALPVAELPSVWRGSAGVLTPSLGAPTTSESGAQSPEASERLVVRVDGGDLGELEVTVDRRNGELQVVIGLENEQLARSVSPDGASLRSALERAGMSVRSLNIVAASEVGTVLARHRTSPTGPKPEPTRDGGPEQDPEATRKRAHKRLTLIG